MQFPKDKIAYTVFGFFAITGFIADVWLLGGKAMDLGFSFDIFRFIIFTVISAGLIWFMIENYKLKRKSEGYLNILYKYPELMKKLLSGEFKYNDLCLILDYNNGAEEYPIWIRRIWDGTQFETYKGWGIDKENQNE